MADLKKTNRPFSNMPGRTPLPNRVSLSGTPPPVAAKPTEAAEAVEARARELEAKLEAALARATKAEGNIAEAKRDQDRARQESLRAIAAATAAEERALRADQALADGMVAMERSRMEREVDRARLIEVEAEVAMTKRDSVQAIEAANGTVDETRRMAAALQARLSRAEDLAAKVTDALTELERLEASATSERAKAIGRARRILGGDER